MILHNNTLFDVKVASFLGGNFDFSFKKNYEKGYSTCGLAQAPEKVLSLREMHPNSQHTNTQTHTSHTSHTSQTNITTQCHSAHTNEGSFICFYCKAPWEGHAHWVPMRMACTDCTGLKRKSVALKAPLNTQPRLHLSLFAFVLYTPWQHHSTLHFVCVRPSVCLNCWLSHCSNFFSFFLFTNQTKFVHYPAVNSKYIHCTK